MSEYRIIPSFIQHLLEAGIPVALTKDSFIVDGFYKSGTVEVKCRGEHEWYAKARYNEETDICGISDLVSLNYQWWQSSKDRFEGWSQPDSRWIALLQKYNYIEDVEIPATITYKAK